MNGDLTFRYDPTAWTYIPRTWPDEEFGRSPARWAKVAARSIEARSQRNTREHRAWLRTTLQRLATMPTSGESALYLFLRELGGPLLTLDVLPLEAHAPAQEATTELLRLVDTDGTVRVPDVVRHHEASGLGAGSRATFTTDDGEGGEQVAVVWAFRAGGTDVRIATVANHPEVFALIEPEVDDFIDGIRVLD